MRQRIAAVVAAPDTHPRHRAVLRRLLGHIAEQIDALDGTGAADH